MKKEEYRLQEFACHHDAYNTFTIHKHVLMDNYYSSAIGYGNRVGRPHRFAELLCSRPIGVCVNYFFVLGSARS
jgi:hypothetical protein